MLLRRATFHNVGPFRHWTLDVEDKRGVIALIAGNGVGKSSAVELGFLGACYRKTKTQGTLKSRATARDAWVETEITHRQAYTIRQAVDPTLKTAGESLVTAADGSDVLGGDTKVSTYDEWAARNLPDDDVFMAGPFCAQKDDGFVSMGSAARIAVILRVLGAAKLERLAKLAAKRASKADDAFQALVTRIADAKSGVLGVDEAGAALAAAQGVHSRADTDLQSCRLVLAERQRAAADHAVKTSARSAAQKLLATLQEQLSGATARRAADETKVAGNRLFQADADAIRSAAARLDAENADLTRLELALAETDKAIRAELDPWRDAGARLQAAELRLSSARARLKDESAIVAAVAAKAELATSVDAERLALAASDREFETLDARKWADSGERLEAFRQGCAAIRDIESVRLDEAPGMAGSMVAADDAAVAAATETPKRLGELKTRLQLERDRLAVAERKLSDAEKLAARAPDLEAARTDQASAEKEIADIKQGHALAVIGAFARSLGRAETAGAARLVGAALETTRKLAKRLEPLNDSDRRIAELETSIASIRDEESRLEEQIKATELVEVGAEPDVTAAERVVAATEEVAKSSAAASVKAAQALERAQEAADKLSNLESERDKVAAALANWSRLELDLGRKGVQASEVDSVGPELTELCNDLLRRCHGPQFTVIVQTQRLDADGKNLIEECNIRVIDSVKGTDKEIREHSGGEQVLLSTTMRLALAMLASRRSGLTDFSLVCDEGGAALDATNSRAFLAMLRHAIAVTGARHVILVSHNEEIQKMCDHQIEIPQAA